MQYTRPSFSAAVSNGSISDTAYEVAVGLRCLNCGNLLADGHELGCAVATNAAVDAFRMSDTQES